MRVAGFPQMAILFAVGLVGCGSSGPAKVVVGPSTALNGNWLLAGTLPFVGSLNASSQSFELATTLVVVGSKMVGGGIHNYPCGNFVASGGGDVISGTIAGDGTFSAQSQSIASRPLLQVKGSVPALGASTWKGSYVFSSNDPTCPTPISGSFVATRIADLTGTFATTVPVSLTSSTQGATVTLVTLTFMLQQGGLQAGSTVPDPQLLSGSVQIQGSSCFKSGTAPVALVAGVLGTSFLMSFTLDDGSKMSVLGDIEDVGTTRLTLHFVLIGGGLCGTMSAGPVELMRQ